MCAPLVIGSRKVCTDEGVSKVCSAPVEIGSGNLLLWHCAPSDGRSLSEDAEEENPFDMRLYAPPQVM